MKNNNRYILLALIISIIIFLVSSSVFYAISSFILLEILILVVITTIGFTKKTSLKREFTQKNQILIMVSLNILTMLIYLGLYSIEGYLLSSISQTQHLKSLLIYVGLVYIESFIITYILDFIVRLLIELPRRNSKSYFVTNIVISSLTIAGFTVGLIMGISMSSVYHITNLMMFHIIFAFTTAIPLFLFITIRYLISLFNEKNKVILNSERSHL